MTIRQTAAFLLAVISQFTAHSQSTDLTAGLAGVPFRLGSSARGISMGNAMSSVQFGDVEAMNNPAVVPFASTRSATVSFGLLTLDRHLNVAGYAQSLPPSAGFALLLVNAGVGTIDGRDRDGLHTEDYSTSENEVLFAFGLKPANDFSIGLGVKLLYYKLFEGIKSTTVGFDLGVLYVISPDVTISGSMLDLNSKYKWDTSALYGLQGTTTTDYFPTRKRVGICFSPGSHKLILSGEFEVISSLSFFRVGSELEVLDGLSVRAGIDQISSAGVVTAKPSFGFSLGKSMGSWEPLINYAYVLEPYAPSGYHVVGLTVRFD